MTGNMVIGPCRSLDLLLIGSDNSLSFSISVVPFCWNQQQIRKMMLSPCRGDQIENSLEYKIDGPGERNRAGVPTLRAVSGELPRGENLVEAAELRRIGSSIPEHLCLQLTLTCAIMNTSYHTVWLIGVITTRWKSRAQLHCTLPAMSGPPKREPVTQSLPRP
jgi:hypothetical protein